MTRRELIPLAAIVLLYAAFAAVTLLDYPPVYSDEPWLLSTPVSLLRHGENALPMFGESYNAMLYFSAYLVPPLAVLGVSLEAARVAAVLHGAFVLVLTWVIARQLGAGSRSWIAPLSLISLYPFLEVTRYVRPEAFELVYALLALVLYLHGRSRGWRWLAAAGAMAGMAFGIFFQAAWVLVILAVWALFDFRHSPRRALALCAGFTVALLPLLVFIAQDPGEYGRFFRKFGNSSIFAERYADKGPLGSAADVFSAEGSRYDRYLTAVDSRMYVAVVAVFVLLAVGVALLPGRRRLLPLVGAAPFVLALLAANKTPGYLVIAAPGIAVAAAVGLARFRFAWSVAFVGALLVTYAGVVKEHYPTGDTSFAELRSEYRSGSKFPDGALVIGLPIHYGFFLDRNVDFRAVHYFTDFDTFELDTASEAEAKLVRDARGNRLYLFRSDGLLGTLASFSPNGRVSPALEELIRSRFRPISTFDFKATPYGDFRDELTVFVASPDHTGPGR